MVSIEYSAYASKQIDNIYSNDCIYDKYGHFTQQFVNWNYEFQQYVNPNIISRQITSSVGIYNIGKIGTLSYKCYIVRNTEIFEIIEFRFTKLPYTSTSGYRVTGNAGYGYKIVQSTFNQLYAILTPQNRLLTKYSFDSIIGFHHSSQDYNTIYAVGFMGNRSYAIYQDGTITVLPYTKQQYLSMKHKFYESKNSVVILESQLRRIIRESIKKVLNII